ncbi:hypothetical protein ACWIGI_18535 [Nocardia sp. NPDC055321]
MESGIEYIDRSFINFRTFEFGPGGHHCFQWIAIKNYKFDNVEMADQQLIAAVMKTVEYRDDYVGGGVDPQGIVHGPYLLSGLSVDSYSASNGQRAVQILKGWLEACGEMPPTLRSAVQKLVVDRLEAPCSTIYTLDDLPNRLRSDFSDIHQAFHEFVIIDRARLELLLVVATDD